MKIYSISQTPPNFKQRTSPEVVHNSRNEASSLARIPFLFAKAGMLSTERVVTGCYWAVWGHTERKKEHVVMGSLGQSGILLQNASGHKCFRFPPLPPTHTHIQLHTNLETRSKTFTEIVTLPAQTGYAKKYIFKWVNDGEEKEYSKCPGNIFQ